MATTKTMRLTMHNARGTKAGAFSAKHNDRQFDTAKADHIDAVKSYRNSYWHCYQQNHPQLTFEQAEAKFYDDHFDKWLAQTNWTRTRSGHPERVQTMDDVRRSKRTCPEEQIFCVGNKDNTIKSKLLLDLMIEQAEWEQQRFPNFKILDIALHMDEAGAAHIHRRGVWLAESDAGLRPNQSDALEQMGVALPNPQAKKSRFNNRKMTYTAECREHMLELCRQHNLVLEDVPKPGSRSGLTLTQYQAKQEQSRMLEMFRHEDAIKQRTERMERRADEAIQRIQELAEGQNADAYEVLHRALNNPDLPTADRQKAHDALQELVEAQRSWEHRQTEAVRQLCDDDELER